MNNAISTHEFISNTIDSKHLKNIEIAEAVGFKNANNVSMIKTGKTRISYDRIPKFAKAIGVSGRKLMTMAYKEYEPEKFAAIQGCLGFIVTENEQKIIEEIRSLTNDSDPAINSKDRIEAIKTLSSHLIT